jgi:integrase
MCSQSQPPTSKLSSHQSSYQFTVGGEMEPLADAEAAAEFLQVSPRRILELARRGVLPGYPLGSGPRHLWRFRLSELARLCSQAGYNANGSLTCLEEKSEMAQGHQRGWLKKERRKDGETWMLFFRTTREADGKRVEQKVAVGTVRDLPTKASAWAEVERQHIHINKPDFRKRATFADLAQHYQQHELGERRSAIVDPKAHTTIAGYKRVLRNRLLPRWGKRMALSIQPLEVEEWLSALKEGELLENPTLDKMRRVMSLVYKHGQRYGLISRREECNPLRFVRCKTISNYEAVILSPEQAFAVLVDLPEPERTLTLLAASTGLRISECLGLQWLDVNFDGSLIHVRRTWTWGKVGQPKSKASQAPVPMHLLLAEFMRAWQIRTPYPQPEDWVFPSFRLGGRKPRAANMLVEDYLRPAAVKAGVIAEGDPCRFGFHNLRHSLASFLVRSKTDPKTVQALLRHSDVKTTLQLYAHSVSADRMMAQGEVLQAILGGATAANSGLNAD